MDSINLKMASACENDMEFNEKLLPERSDRLNLETLNSDCQQFILDYLEIEDLLNVAESSKKLYVAACLAFRRYAKCNVGIGHPYSPIKRER